MAAAVRFAASTAAAIVLLRPGLARLGRRVLCEGGACRVFLRGPLK